jgi:hypothetical protein
MCVIDMRNDALDCIYLLPSGGGLDSRWSIVVASAAAGGMSPSQRPRTSAARRARSRRPTDGRWRVGGAGCGGAGPRAAAAQQAAPQRPLNVEARDPA